MADFTQYGSESSDWRAYMKLNPPPQQSKKLTALELQQFTNEGREANSVEILKTITAAISTQDFSCPTTGGQTISLRVYKTSTTSVEVRPVYVYFHGGGFCFGTLSSEDGFCSWIAEKTGVIVVNVCYRHTPEWKWPAQREDAYEALNWVFENITTLGGDRDKVLVGGRSSGSNLSAGIALRDKDVYGKSRIKGLILDLPHVCHTDAFPFELMAKGKSSYEQHSDAPILPRSRIDFFNKLLSVKDPRERYYSTLLVADSELESWPPTHFLVAGRDPLIDEALLFEEKLKRIGIQTRVNVYPGVPHGFRRYGELKMSRAYDEDLLRAFEWLLR